MPDPGIAADVGGIRVLSVHSITRITSEHAGQVVIAASHGGVYAGFCAAKGRTRAVIFNDAGVGRERAGIGSLAYLDALGIAAATADSRTCRIGDGDDMRESGVVSFVNATAAALGCAPGQRVRDCADRMRAASASHQAVPAQAEARFVVHAASGARPVVVMDSVSLVQSSDAGAIIVTASHGGLLGGDPASALKVDALAAVYCDAGFGKERAGVTRLPALDARGIAAATVSSHSARIGDGRSVYEDGVVSCVNKTASSIGINAGDTVKEMICKALGGGRR